MVYVDNDPVVFAHGNAVLATNGHTRVIQADLRDPDQILGHREICSLIDPGRPVAILLVAVLHFLGDADDPYAIVAGLREAAAPGSHLVVSHLTGDCDPAKGWEAVQIWERARAAVVPTLRTRRQVEGFLPDGWHAWTDGLLWRAVYHGDDAAQRARAGYLVFACDPTPVGLVAGIRNRLKKTPFQMDR